MITAIRTLGVIASLTLMGSSPGAAIAAEAPDLRVLPEGVRAVWDLETAHREVTPARERVCLNGLWRWQPAVEQQSRPGTNWGYFKVPGSWPGITDYMLKDTQLVYPHPAWKSYQPARVTSAWYEREFMVPREWKGRRVGLALETLNSIALVWINGERAGELRFPGGELDLTGACPPGQKHRLTLLVHALPLRETMMSFADTTGAKPTAGKVERRGLCGDVFLTGVPAGPRIDDVCVRTSVRRGEIEVEVALAAVEERSEYCLKARVLKGGREVTEFLSPIVTAADLKNGRLIFGAGWQPEELWDLHTPGNQFDLEVSLLAPELLDAHWPVRFGFRELWVDGKDFYLNGTRIYLCALPLDNAQAGAAWATYDAARDTFQRLKSFGVNFAYTHNYGCEPGTHLSFTEILRAADDEGVLVAFAQPHFGQYDWSSQEADATNGYAAHARHYVRAAQNHPSVTFYSMSHNSVGTVEGMNPAMIDGIQDVRDSWSANNARRAARAEAIVRTLDPSRVVYHHSGANLGSVYTQNFYANFAPIQEMSDWFLHWADEGVKPLFLCEYGSPISWDWAMYRGWYGGAREFGSARVPWELCLAEWNAQFLGARAFEISELEKQCLRWEAKQLQAGRTWFRWDYPAGAFSSPEFELRNEILARYLTENIRAFRTLGVSAFCPWDHGMFWKLKPDAPRARRHLATNWEHLQRPGFSPDFIEDQMALINTGFRLADWEPTAAARALSANNRPLLAYIAGKPGAVTSKEHNFRPGEEIRKQLLVLNNSRARVGVRCSWTGPFDHAPQKLETDLETGQQLRVPIRFTVPETASPGSCTLIANVQFSTGETQMDTFRLDILSPAALTALPAPISIWDPQGATTAALTRAGLKVRSLSRISDAGDVDVLFLGRGALTLQGQGPDLSAVRQGRRVVVFEQTAEVLERRLGFRVAEYGLRQAFVRVPGHELLAGAEEQHLADWRGEATILSPTLNYRIGDRHAPEVTWCGLPVTRLWRAGSRGNVASVLIEKPARGDFLPVIDGGFGLQYSPLLEYCEGEGMVLFCQLDVSGRTESDPAAEHLLRNICTYVSHWRPNPRREVVVSGGERCRLDLATAGAAPLAYVTGQVPTNALVVIGQGSKADPQGARELIASAGSTLLFLALPQSVADAWLGNTFQFRTEEHIATTFPAFQNNTWLAGVSPAEVFNRDPRDVALVVNGGSRVGNGVLAFSQQPAVVFCQLTPSDFLHREGAHVRRTHRRVSVLLARLLGNLGVGLSTPLLERFAAAPTDGESRWLSGLYVDEPREWDDPYRFFCW